MKNAIVALALAVLVWPGAAAAKELKSVTVCGADACREVSHERLQQYIGIFMDPPGVPGGRTGDVAKVSSVRDSVPVAPYYKIGLKARGGGTRTFDAVYWYVRPDLFRPAGDRGTLIDPFRRISAPFVQDIARIAEGLEPYPPPRVVRATVGEIPLAQPGRLTALFSGTRVSEESASTGGTTATLYLRPNRANPWFAANMQFLYLPESQILLLDNPVRVDPDIASWIARQGGFAPTVDRDRDWVRTAGLGVVVFGLLLALALYVVRTRRRPGTATA